MLLAFDGTNGSYPYNKSGHVAVDSEGNLYGTAAYGGANGYGTVFKLAAGSFLYTDLHDFDFNGTDGLTLAAGSVWTLWATSTEPPPSVAAVIAAQFGRLRTRELSGRCSSQTSARGLLGYGRLSLIGDVACGHVPPGKRGKAEFGSDLALTSRRRNQMNKSWSRSAIAKTFVFLFVLVAASGARPIRLSPVSTVPTAPMHSRRRSSTTG